MKSKWPTIKLGEICEKIKKEKAPVGTIPYIEIGNVDVNSKKVIFNEKGAVKGSIFAPENSILISRVRPTRGAVTFIDKKTAVSSAFTIIKPKPKCNPKLLFYFLAWNKKFFDYLGEKQKGTNYPSVREKDVLEFEISFPENGEEQQKVVKILDTIQEAIDIHDNIIEKTKELKKSLMNLLFHYGLAGLRVKELASSRVSELTSFEIETLGLKLKKTEIGEVPEDWEVVRLGDVTKEIIYGISKKGEKEGRYPILRMNNLEDGKINCLDLQYVGLEDIEFEKFKLEKGDILFNRTNSLELVGKTALFNLDGNFVFASYLLRIRTLKDKLLPEFLNYYFNFEKTQKELKTLAYRGASQVNISASRLSGKLIPLPPLPEQQEIAEILQTVDQKIEIERRKKELYEELFKTMLNKIMNQEIDDTLLNY
jgi:type I restriction enzyme S subunit